MTGSPAAGTWLLWNVPAPEGSSDPKASTSSVNCKLTSVQSCPENSQGDVRPGSRGGRKGNPTRPRVEAPFLLFLWESEQQPVSSKPLIPALLPGHSAPFDTLLLPRFPRCLPPTLTPRDLYLGTSWRLPWARTGPTFSSSWRLPPFSQDESSLVSE